jgi:hypothetical protein
VVVVSVVAGAVVPVVPASGDWLVWQAASARAATADPIIHVRVRIVFLLLGVGLTGRE